MSDFQNRVEAMDAYEIIEALERAETERDRARHLAMMVARDHGIAEDERDKLRVAIQGLFAAMDLCLGRGWRAETLGQGKQGDAVNRAWDECARLLVVDPVTLEEKQG